MTTVIFIRGGLMLEARPGPLPRRLVAHLAALDLPEGAHISEQALADAMGVSRTPIRRALLEIAKSGLLQSRERRGYFLTIPSRSMFAARFDFDVVDSDDLFARIASDYLSEELGAKFTEAMIIKRYGVSSRLAQRTLQMLRDENVIEAEAGGGWRFNPFLVTDEASAASYAFRIIIEPPIPLLPTFRPKRDLIRHCRDEHLRLLSLGTAERTPRLAFRVDSMFHETVAASSGNLFLQTSVVQQNRLRQLLEYRDSAEQERIVIWVREHLDILDAINASAYQEASSLLLKHLNNAMARQKGSTAAAIGRASADT